MRHPEILLLPFLMLADYYLTLVAAIQQAKKYSEHFRNEQYELNPTLQAAVAKRRWFNPKCLLVTAVFSTAVIALVGFVELPPPVAEAIVGCFFVLYAMLIARHVFNLFVFRYVIRHPDHISGQVTMRHAMLLRLSLYQYCVAAVPIVLVAVFSRNSFAIGGCFAAMLLLGWHSKWITMARKAEAAAAHKERCSPGVTPENSEGGRQEANVV
jgi:hypothetical protein